MKPIGLEFMKATRPGQLSRSPQDQGEPQPALEIPLPEGAPIIPLPQPASLEIPEISLRQAIENRRSVRRYAETPLTMDELSYLLWLTQGVQEFTNRPATLRPVPSAGARHAFETYLLINCVSGCEPGLYRFAAGQHALAHLPAPQDIREQIIQACFNRPKMHRSAVTFIWVAVVERMTWRYVERGYRYLHLDAGHVCQNLYLAAEAIGCGVCAVGSYDDDRLNSALGLDGENLFVLYLASLGKRLAGS